MRASTLLARLCARLHGVPFAARPRSPGAAADALPESKVVTIGGFRIGLSHGHAVAPAGEVEALACVLRALDVDVLVSGHTHGSSIAEFDGKCYINPGSLTGAYSPLAAARAGGAGGDPSSPTQALAAAQPSFMLMNIQENKIDFFLYELTQEGKLRISKSTHTKSARATAAA